MKIQLKPEEFQKKCEPCLQKLFADAKAKDEFEYICALLRIRGMESAGWDPLHETNNLVEDMMSLINTPLQDPTRLRLALLTYCHVLEVDTIYGVIENMLSIIEGKRCSVEPFWNLYTSKVKGEKKSRMTGVRPPSSARVVKHICDHAERLNRLDLKELLETMYDENIRNTFFHSDYVIYQDEYRSPEKRFARKISNLSDLINCGFVFFHIFMRRLVADIQSYKTPKIVMGRIRGEENPPVEMELDVDPERGVYGFHSYIPKPPPKTDEAA